MIVVIGGRAGAGKSTVAKALAERLGLRHYSIGDFQRQIAERKGVSLLELSKLEENDESIDRELDQKQKKLGEEQDNFVIDGRLSAFFIPNADFKIFLEADEMIRAERILKDKRKEEKGEDTNIIIKELKEREESETKRYRVYYDLDCYDKSKYDVVIDTTSLTIKDIVNKVYKLIKETLEKKSLEKG